MSRRFLTPGDLLRAYESHQFTGANLDKLKAEWADEQEALERELKPLLVKCPHGVRHHETVLSLDRGRDRIVAAPAPVHSFDLVDWVDVDALGRQEPGPSSETIGPGPDAPSYTVPANADHYPVEVGLLGHLVGAEVHDEDGDDY